MLKAEIHLATPFTQQPEDRDRCIDSGVLHGVFLYCATQMPDSGIIRGNTKFENYRSSISTAVMLR